MSYQSGTPERRVVYAFADDIAMLERLRAFANSIGTCTCAPGMCDTKSDLQCRAREAITGVNNQQKADGSKA